MTKQVIRQMDRGTNMQQALCPRNKAGGLGVSYEAPRRRGAEKERGFRKRKLVHAPVLDQSHGPLGKPSLRQKGELRVCGCAGSFLPQL